jgi:hypothetical protein
MSGKNSSRFKWSLEKIQTEADQFSDRQSFKKGSPKAYNAACEKGLLGIVCSKMPRPSNTAYTRKELEYFIKGHNSIKSFREAHPGPYGVAVKRNDWKNLSTNLKRSPISSPEKTILDAVLKIYPTAIKFIATKLDILGKPHIKKLEVDILVPELRKAIEFDGRYHHSLVGLKRGHPTWPEEDLKMYHKIKDDAFMSRGIKILHIKEEAWRKNRQACIDKCLAFLAGDPCL